MRIAQFDSCTGAVLAAGPTGVNLPDINAGCIHLLSEEFRVFCGMPNQKRSAEAGRERSLWFGNADLGSRHLIRYRSGKNAQLASSSILRLIRGHIFSVKPSLIRYLINAASRSELIGGVADNRNCFRPSMVGCS
jgi:hypothetical protein